MTIHTLSEEFGIEPHGIRAILALEDAGTDYTPIEELCWAPADAEDVLTRTGADGIYR